MPDAGVTGTVLQVFVCPYCVVIVWNQLRIEINMPYSLPCTVLLWYSTQVWYQWVKQDVSGGEKCIQKCWLGNLKVQIRNIGTCGKILALGAELYVDICVYIYIYICVCVYIYLFNTWLPFKFWSALFCWIEFQYQRVSIDLKKIYAVGMSAGISSKWGSVVGFCEDDSAGVHNFPKS